jgi:hypothetical protein
VGGLAVVLLELKLLKSAIVTTLAYRGDFSNGLCPSRSPTDRQDRPKFAAVSATRTQSTDPYVLSSMQQHSESLCTGLYQRFTAGSG